MCGYSPYPVLYVLLNQLCRQLYLGEVLCNAFFFAAYLIPLMKSSTGEGRICDEVKKLLRLKVYNSPFRIGINLTYSPCVARPVK